MDTRLTNVIIALADETRLINAGKQDKNTHNRLKNIINAWIEWKTTAPNSPDTHKYKIGDILQNTKADPVKDITPPVLTSSFSSLIIKFLPSLPSAGPDTGTGPKLIIPNYRVLLIDNTNNVYVNVIDILQNEFVIPAAPPSPVLSADDKIIKDFLSKLLVNVKLKEKTLGKSINSIVFNEDAKNKFIAQFKANSIENYNLVRFREVSVSPSDELYVSYTISTEDKAKLGIESTSTAYIFTLNGDFNDTTGVYTINEYKTLKQQPWMKGGATTKLKMQIILEKINGPAITVVADAAALSATSAAAALSVTSAGPGSATSTAAAPLSASTAAPGLGSATSSAAAPLSATSSAASDTDSTLPP